MTFSYPCHAGELSFILDSAWIGSANISSKNSTLFKSEGDLLVSHMIMPFLSDIYHLNHVIRYCGRYRKFFLIS